jgi:hypothetical protein
MSSSMTEPGVTSNRRSFFEEGSGRPPGVAGRLML